MRNETIFSKVDKKLMDILSLFEKMAVENKKINGREVPESAVPYNSELYTQILEYTRGVRRHYVQLAFLYGELYAVKILREMVTAYYGPSEGASE